MLVKVYTLIIYTNTFNFMMIIEFIQEYNKNIHITSQY